MFKKKGGKVADYEDNADVQLIEQNADDTKSKKVFADGDESDQGGQEKATEKIIPMIVDNNNSNTGSTTLKRASSSNLELRKHITVPLIILLIVTVCFPLVVGVIATWYFSSNRGELHVDEYTHEVEVQADNIIEDKMDSIIDGAILKVKSIYEHALRETESGSHVESHIEDDSHLDQLKMLSFWTESAAKPFNYPMVHITFECNGHVIGTGYEKETGEYTAWYTDFHYAFNNYESSNNIQYDADGCVPYTADASFSKEVTYRTKFNTLDGWQQIETEGFTGHGEKSFEDNRIDPLYQTIKKSTSGCAWSEVTVSREPPYEEFISVGTAIIGHDDTFVGTVHAQVPLASIDKLVHELGADLDSLSIAIVDDSDRVVTASEGGNYHPIVESCTGEASVELYTLQEYADVVKVESGNMYNYLLQYMDENPKFLTKMDDHLADISDENVYHYKSTHGTFYTTAGLKMLLAGVHLVDKCELSYRIYVILEEAELIADIQAENKNAHAQISNVTMKILLGVFGGGLGVVLLTFLLARTISAPLREIRKDINILTELDFSGSLTIFRPFVTELKAMVEHYMKLKVTFCDFNCFVPPHILDELVDFGDDAIVRAAVPKEIGVLFVYVSNFSAASHNSESRVVADFANQFIGDAADLLTNMSGTVIDFFGDSLFGIFNAPYDEPNYVKNAMECAHEIIALFERVKAQFMSENPDFQLIEVRVGLHCGEALVGKIGSKSRLKYCAVGDTVNLGSRIENMNRRYGSQLVCSSDFFNALEDHRDNYCSRPMEYVKVQGRSDPILIYEIGGLINSVAENKLTEFKAHTDLFFNLRAGQSGEDELEAHIKKYGGNSTFLHSATVNTSSLKEIKKLE